MAQSLFADPFVVDVLASGFTPSATPIESLIQAVKGLDLFALNPDDTITSRDEIILRPRDNVVFEMGLYRSSW